VEHADRDRSLALTLLAEHRARIAAAVVRFARRLEPKWTAVPETVAMASATNQIKAIEQFLRSDDGEVLLSTVRDLVRLRKHTGFGVGDFAVKSHAYLPVIRRVFLQSNRAQSDSLRAYDVVESAMLPMIARLLQELAAEPADTSLDDDDTDVTVPGKRGALHSLNPFTMVDVDADL
jgi:hypothetical protein